LKIRNSAKALIVRDGQLLAMKKEGKNGYFYILIGGGQQFGETLRDAVKRECREEAGIDVEPGQLLFVREYIGSTHEFSDTDSHRHFMEFLFFCQPLSEPDPAKATEIDEGQVGFEWLPLETIDTVGLYPLALRQAIREHFLLGMAQPVYQGNIN